MTMWGGRFSGVTAQEFRDFNDSLRFDYKLAPFELQCCQAWVHVLHEQNVLTAAEAEQLQQGLADLQTEIVTNPELPLATGAEDIHGWVEAILEQRIGLVARKLHTGRSRNDLVATDLRLYALSACLQVGTALLGVIEALLHFAERYEQQIMPGYTHLQRAQ